MEQLTNSKTITLTTDNIFSWLTVAEKSESNYNLPYIIDFKDLIDEIAYYSNYKHQYEIELTEINSFKEYVLVYDEIYKSDKVTKCYESVTWAELSDMLLYDFGKDIAEVLTLDGYNVEIND